LTSGMRRAPKWNTLAARTASAPASIAGGKWPTSPAPPLAITGTATAARARRINSRSKPAFVPSASIELSRISPAPRSTARRAQSMASMPVPRRPPWVVTSKPLGVGGVPSGTRRASTDRTTHCAPNCRDASASSSGRAMAAVLSDTLSAPARRRAFTSAVDRTPPPTVSGMKTCSAVRRTTSYMVSRPPLDAVMSRNVSSSAPSASYLAASSTGSPASRRFRKLTPLTTRPPSTSRHGITRTATVTPSPPRGLLGG
jgi:hypothetical protein